ncbi:PIG-L deacetylase family protein [Brevibacillus choshinensis]|uniref:PIG-L family deacetylase n=1 Tax=Brevibacillus choshinensis TaxID=54911 RepID=A0ABX7FWW3_BRECH|nr:PIG-L family deacetylase [Brevibacillus choshinensis]QRG69880.1 PIG-L family deacetylase [Brevibacillus choshinensis]
MKKHGILFIFAHPDDETFTSGITISKYHHEQSASCYLVTATRGQAGKPGNPPICSLEELPRVREQELRDASSILGVSALEIWDYEDKNLSFVPLEELIINIHEVISRLRPEVVVTFAPHGISGHPDHKSISNATTQAIHRLPENSSVRKLYYATRASSGTLTAPPPYTDSYDTITTIIDAPAFKEQVASALRAHRTQHLSVDRVFPGVTSGDAANVPPRNHFILAWTNLPNVNVEDKESDLLAGLRV